ncbi:hypothetical protein NLX86_06815 [Streptomyces sp. A3M-1-3]|uniref:hypothetical protein n=1 Tax=Streptomyces sp. A3M-1-3 TaxID=2962044 RepID=UPI0020B6AF3D|nr:hypothetical protein [Streptomyces sp. A3M-1-3]MCP3817859.1 hypothetical protein [Streptomyces sp. A3M-1-3]
MSGSAPGLEYAGRIARGTWSAGRTAVRVLVVEDGGAVDRQFGERAAGRLASTAGTVGVETVRHARAE